MNKRYSYAIGVGLAFKIGGLFTQLSRQKGSKLCGGRCPLILENGSIFALKVQLVFVTLLFRSQKTVVYLDFGFKDRFNSGNRPGVRGFNFW